MTDTAVQMMGQTPNRSEPLPPDDEKRLRMAWAVLVLGMAQHDVAALFSTNAGRVAEVVTAIRQACARGNHHD